MLADWGPGWGVFWGLLWAAFWVVVILVAVWLLRGELPRLQHRFGEPPALRLLEERYARGEISREDFLERRAVLLQPPPGSEATPPPPPAGSAGESTSEAGPTQPIPPSSPSG
jgi:putative membrane protein